MLPVMPKPFSSKYFKPMEMSFFYGGGYKSHVNRNINKRRLKKAFNKLQQKMNQSSSGMTII